MKPLFLAPVVAGLLGFLGCANEGPTGEELQEQVGRGLRGEGTLSPDIDRTGDPYVKPREGAPPTRE
ncbi:MAG: hypothetical protein ABR589_04420 [Chthoniobacterales bacterium]